MKYIFLAIILVLLFIVAYYIYVLMTQTPETKAFKDALKVSDDWETLKSKKKIISPERRDALRAIMEAVDEMKMEHNGTKVLYELMKNQRIGVPEEIQEKEEIEFLPPIPMEEIHKEYQYLRKAINRLQGYAYTPKSFILACKAANYKAVNAFLERGMSPNTKAPCIEAEDTEAIFTPLTVLAYFAIPYRYKNEDGKVITQEGSFDENTNAVINLLLKGGADPNLEGGPDQVPPLCIVVKGGHEKSVDLLLKAGAKPDWKDIEGRTALWIAARGVDKEKYFLEDGIDNYYYDASPGTRPSNMLHLLLEAGADVEVASRTDGITPIMRAADMAKLNLCRMLLAFGAQPQVRDRYGKSAIDRIDGLKPVKKGDRFFDEAGREELHKLLKRAY